MKPTVDQMIEEMVRLGGPHPSRPASDITRPRPGEQAWLHFCDSNGTVLLAEVVPGELINQVHRAAQQVVTAVVVEARSEMPTASILDLTTRLIQSGYREKWGSWLSLGSKEKGHLITEYVPCGVVKGLKEKCLRALEDIIYLSEGDLPRCAHKECSARLPCRQSTL